MAFHIVRRPGPPIALDGNFPADRELAVQPARGQIAIGEDSPAERDKVEIQKAQVPFNLYLVDVRASIAGRRR